MSNVATRTKKMLSFLVAGAAALVSVNAHASSTLNGSVCQTFYGSSATTLNRGANGATNTTGGINYLICPVVRTSPTGSGANINVYFTKGGTGVNYMYAYSLDVWGNLVDSKSLTWTVGYAGQNVPWTNNHVNVSAWGSYAVIGLMNANDVINSVSVTD
jgi:hypothetical protein